MRFNPNYRSKDGIFEIEVYMDSLDYVSRRKPDYNITNENASRNGIVVFNTKTYSLSWKTLYFGKDNRLYFNGGKRYYIDELEEIKYEEN